MTDYGAQLPVRLRLADGPCWPDTRRSLYASALAQLGGFLPFPRILTEPPGPTLSGCSFRFVSE
jgi:hypothetical protein